MISETQVVVVEGIYKENNVKKRQARSGRPVTVTESAIASRGNSDHEESP